MLDDTRRVDERVSTRRPSIEGAGRAKVAPMHGLRTLVLDVDDLAAARAFYARALQKEPYFDQPFYVGFDVDGFELGLRPAEGERRPGAGGAIAYLAVHDVDAELARWVALGARVREAPEDVGDGIRVASVLDPSGNVVGLIRNLGFAPRLVSAGADDLAERAIVHERRVSLPRADVWGLWSSRAGLVRWLVDDAHVELRPGGAYEVYFLTDAPRGLRGSETCRVLSFVPGRMLSFTWNAPPHLARTRWLHTWVVVELEDDGEGTRVRVTHTGWPASGLRDEPQWAETFAYFERAWAGVLDGLVRFATAGTKAS
jgi:uncharacterized protein YndB with AHSA1/START domain/predicted enzyme related to lactoylglutathione lyase